MKWNEFRGQIFTPQITLEDWGVKIEGEGQREENGRWVYRFPWEIAFTDKTLLEPETEFWEGDFAEILEWALGKNIIEDFSREPKEGLVWLGGCTVIDWSEQRQDVIETVRGRHCLTFKQFLDYLEEKDILDFLISKLTDEK